MGEVKWKKQFTCFPRLPPELRLMIWEATLPGARIVELEQRSLKKTIRQWEKENRTNWPMEDDDYINKSASEQEAIRRENHVTRLRLGGDPDYFNAGAYKKCHLLGFKSHHEDLVITYVCRESYELVSRSWPKLFATAYSKPQTEFNVNLDTLCLRYEKISWNYLSGGSSFDVLQDSLSGAFGFSVYDRHRVLPKVKRLAVSINTNLWPSRSIEDTIGNILTVFSWSAIEELILLVNRQYYQSMWQLQHDEDEHDICFIDAVDVHQAIKASDEYQWGAECDDLEVPMLDCSKLAVSFAELEKRRLAFMENSGYTARMPKIACKIAVPTKLKKALDASRATYEAQIARHERALAALEEQEFYRGVPLVVLDDDEEDGDPPTDGAPVIILDDDEDKQNLHTDECNSTEELLSLSWMMMKTRKVCLRRRPNHSLPQATGMINFPRI